MLLLKHLQRVKLRHCTKRWQ